MGSLRHVGVEDLAEARAGAVRVCRALAEAGCGAAGRDPVLAAPVLAVVELAEHRYFPT